MIFPGFCFGGAADTCPAQYAAAGTKHSWSQVGGGGGGHRDECRSEQGLQGRRVGPHHGAAGGVPGPAAPLPTFLS